MHQIINAAYCIHYDDYDFLLDVVRSVREASTGVELAIYTDKPDFMAKQALQKLEMEKVYKVPLVTIGYMNYVNTSRVAIPESVTDLGCPGHRVDMEFASWYIK